MVGIKEHKTLMANVKKQINESKGLHKKDLIRYYERLKKELLYVESQLKGTEYEG